MIPSRVCDLDALVARVERPCREHVRVELTAGEFPNSSPGQFLELRCGDALPACTPRAVDWDGDAAPQLAHATQRAPYVRRPFSIADRWDAGGAAHLVVISRDVGAGTHYLDGLRAGDTLNLTGPIGMPFRVPLDDRPLLLVGGGVGIPPLLYLSRVLHARGKRRVVVIFGAMSADLMPVPLIEEPRADGAPIRCFELPGEAPFPAAMTTDDGSAGMRGRVTDAMRAMRSTLDGGTPLVYACGPEAMLHAVARLTRDLGWDCQLCIERNMACGLGTCLSCVARVRDVSRAEGWRWALTCQEGPVFDRDTLVDENT